mmetsp:Transcript_4518/g.19212  ORF Transcript_4518/g.19212 Transcript_4518/m.19212 type:complete len:239 (+) Transcript_4518:3327-4043(+)
MDGPRGRGSLPGGAARPRGRRRGGCLCNRGPPPGALPRCILQHVGSPPQPEHAPPPDRPRVPRGARGRAPGAPHRHLRGAGPALRPLVRVHAHGARLQAALPREARGRARQGSQLPPALARGREPRARRAAGCWWRGGSGRRGCWGQQGGPAPASRLDRGRPAALRGRPRHALRRPNRAHCGRDAGARRPRLPPLRGAPAAGVRHGRRLRASQRGGTARRRGRAPAPRGRRVARARSS